MRDRDDVPVVKGRPVMRGQFAQPTQPLAPTRSEQATASQLRAANGASPQMRASGVRVEQAR